MIEHVRNKVITKRESGKFYPAINVKVYNYLNREDLKNKCYLSEDQVEEVGTKCFEIAQTIFWDHDAQEIADEVFINYDAEVYSSGRSGGYVIVDNLPPVESWEEEEIKQWVEFKKRIKAVISSYDSINFVKDQLKHTIQVGDNDPEITNALRFTDEHRFYPNNIHTEMESPEHYIKYNLIQAIDKNGLAPRNRFNRIREIKKACEDFFLNQTLINTVTSHHPFGFFTVNKINHQGNERNVGYMVGKNYKIEKLNELWDIEDFKFNSIMSNLSSLLDSVINSI